MNILRYLILLLSVTLIINSQAEFDISSLDIDEINKMEISKNGTGLLITYKDSEGNGFVWHNGDNFGPLDGFLYFSRQEKLNSSDGKNFFVKYADAQNNENYITKNKVGEFKQELSDEGFFNKAGKPAYAFIEENQLFIQTWDGVEGPIDSADMIGNFRSYEDGTVGVSYLHNRKDYIYFDGKITGPLENVSVQSIQFPENNKTFAYRQGSENGKNFYVIGEEKFGPYNIGSDHISFSENREEWGFIFRKENEAYVRTSSNEFGPFPNFDFATDLKIFNNNPNEFGYLYMVEKDTALYLQKSNGINKKIDVPSFRIAQPLFSNDGEYFKFIIRMNGKDYVQINNELFGPFETGDRNFYKASFNGKAKEFKFKKHNRAFLSINNNYVGPFYNFDYQINENSAFIGFINPEMTKAGIQRLSLNEKNNINIIGEETIINYSLKLNDKEVSFDIPFGWNTLNLHKITRIFPGVMLYKNDFNVSDFVDNLLENGKIELEDNKVIVVSAQGKYDKNEDLLKLVNEQINQLKNVSIREKPRMIDFKEKSIAYAGLIADNYTYAKLGWFYVDDELIFAAVYQTDEPVEYFDETDWNILSSINIE
ncbi:MAG: hypothetical protein U5K00_09250 [Melioribacteraceae bacterium]|nr:hypothetical protein [Melioribacteraceae bacterium]